MPGERFWLGRIGDDTGNALAAPCRLKHSLITHVKPGDVVFLYDDALQAIVASSTARGRPRSTRLLWPVSSEGTRPDSTMPRLLASWVIELESATGLDTNVTFDEIARVQSEQFASLRAFEEQVGGPLDYPFAVESPSDTRLLAGHAFKLPALFVEWFPPLARVAARMKWSAVARARSSDRLRTKAESVAQAPAAGIVRA